MNHLLGNLPVVVRLHVGSVSQNNSKVFFEFSIYSNFYEIFEPFSVEEIYTKGESVYTTLFGVCKVTTKIVFELKHTFWFMM